ncbi:MAG: FecR family protein [Acidiferrobacterales bacterium]
MLSQDIVETHSGGSAQLEMNDGSILRLGPKSRLALSEYRLDDHGNVVSAALDVISGWLRFQVAKLHQAAAFNIDTPVMTIGIRGTEGMIDASANQGGLYLEEGMVRVKTQNHASVGPQTTRVSTGQYIERSRGRMFSHSNGMPTAFRNRMPPDFRARIVRRIRFLRERGVPPRRIRRLTHRDVERFLHRHPHMRAQTQRQFRERLREHPQQRTDRIQRERERERKQGHEQHHRQLR